MTHWILAWLVALQSFVSPMPASRQTLVQSPPRDAQPRDADGIVTSDAQIAAASFHVDEALF